MKDGKPGSAGDPEGRRPSAGGRKGAGPSRQHNFVERAMARGHSGHGSESVRPHLRDQLRLKSLLPAPYPMPDTPQPGKDEQQR